MREEEEQQQQWCINPSNIPPPIHTQYTYKYICLNTSHTPHAASPGAPAAAAGPTAHGSVGPSSSSSLLWLCVCFFLNVVRVRVCVDEGDGEGEIERMGGGRARETHT